MKFWDAILSALDALRLHKLRSALTMLGIVIGVAAVIAMVAVGGGAREQVVAQIRSLGANLLVVIPGNVTQGGVRLGFGSPRADEDNPRYRQGSLHVRHCAVMRARQRSRADRIWATTATESISAGRGARMGGRNRPHVRAEEIDAASGGADRRDVRKIFRWRDPCARSVARCRSPSRFMAKKANRASAGPGRRGADALDPRASACSAAIWPCLSGRRIYGKWRRREPECRRRSEGAAGVRHRLQRTGEILGPSPRESPHPEAARARSHCCSPPSPVCRSRFGASELSKKNHAALTEGPARSACAWRRARPRDPRQFLSEAASLAHWRASRRETGVGGPYIIANSAAGRSWSDQVNRARSPFRAWRRFFGW